MTPASIQLQNVGLRRGETWIVRNIHWTVPDGACAAILGPNGSGKSSLARIMACHVWPTEGQIDVLGGHFGDANLTDIRHDIRLVQPAGPYDIDPELTALEVVATGFFGTIGLYDPVTDEQWERARQILKQVGMGRLETHKYSTMSSGERVRSLIARALVVRPRLLLLDEPTAGLDLRAREQVLATIEEMFQAGRNPPTCIMITHHVEELPPATSHVLLLDSGKVAAAGRPSEVLRAETLSAVYRIEVNVHQTDGRYHLHVNPGKWQQLLGPEAS